MTSTLVQLSTLIEERTGIAIRAQLKDILLDILAHYAEVPNYLETLARSRYAEPIWQSLIDMLTIGETYFLRDRAQFEALRGHILPALIEQRRAEGTLYLNLWSAGCATGEEAYSLAITLREAIPDLDRWRIYLVGSDLNTNALKTAQRGLYRSWAFRLTEDTFQKRYFDAVTGRLRIKPDVQQMVTFRQGNLLVEKPIRQFDVIFCRNVLLYFSDLHVRQSENTLFDALLPGGWLMLGAAEGLRYQRERWQMHLFPGTAAYQKPVTPEADPHLHIHNPPRPVAILPPPAAPPTYNDAVSALQNEDYTRADALLRELLHTTPESAPVHLLMAYHMANQNAQKQAHHHLNTALVLDPLLADGHYLRALLMLEDGDIPAAQKSLNAALYCQRNHPLASFLLGNLLAQQGELPQAVRHWRNTSQAITALRSDSPVSDISDISAGQLQALVREQLQGWTA